mgnify:CR=1 FL=1
MRTLKKQDNQQKALRYFMMGLTAREIGKLLDCSFRTIERYVLDGRWKRPTDNRTMKEKAWELVVNDGKTYLEASEMLGVSKSTIYNYIKCQKPKE